MTAGWTALMCVLIITALIAGFGLGYASAVNDQTKKRDSK